MKNFINAYKYAIIVILMLVFVIILQKCGTKHTNSVLTTTELNAALSKQKDSINTANLQAQNRAIESVRIVESQKAKVSAYAAQMHANTANKYITKANRLQAELDSLKLSKAPCETQLGKCFDTNDTLYKVIAQNDSTIEDLGQEAESYSRQLYLSNVQLQNDSIILISKISLISETTRINDQLRNELKSKNNWFNRNKLWLGMVAGAAGMYLILK